VVRAENQGDGMSFTIVIRIPKDKLKELGIDEDRFLTRIKNKAESELKGCEVKIIKGLEVSEP